MKRLVALLLILAFALTIQFSPRVDADAEGH